MAKFTRLELRLDQLQRKVEENFGVHIENPEVLIEILGISEEFEEPYYVYEEYDDGDDFPVVVIEGYRRRRSRRQ
jgi:hypothetical protein